MNKELLETLFKAASIQRWNDHIRPHTRFSELDKQAHKMVFAYVLAKIEQEDRGTGYDWVHLIEGCIFELLHRTVLTDLKPSIFHKLMDQKSRELNEWVLKQLDHAVNNIDGSFSDKFKSYLFDPAYSKGEKKILKAAHYLATNWEFQIIYHMNSPLFGLEETRMSIENELEEHFDLAGVQKIALKKRTSGFLDMVGQLRFQQRWAQSPRVPDTSVMGHMLIVAIMTYLCSLKINACDQRIYNNFIAGLFHDLPEVLTRDIISPVKRSVEGLEEIIKDIERIQFEERIIPLLPSPCKQEIRFLVESEFQTKILINGNFCNCSSDDINELYNFDKFLPLDGELIKICDHLAAFIEASMSVSYGLKAPDLVKGSQEIYERYARTNVAGIDFKPIFDMFK